MSRRRSTVSSLINQLHPDITRRLLNYKIPKASLKKLEIEEKKESVEDIEDLRDLPTHSESDVYLALNHIAELKQYKYLT